PVPRLCGRQAGSASAGLRRSAAVLVRDDVRPRHRRRRRRALRPCVGGRIPGHQPVAVGHPAGNEAGRPRAD
ncbi:hypothetical protein H2201_009446, partial [Coniosporium apollinis]